MRHQLPEGVAWRPALSCLRPLRLALLLCLSGGAAFAQPAQSVKPSKSSVPVKTAHLPYEVQADAAVFDQKQGTGVYTGHVQLNRGPERLKADKMTLTLNRNKRLDHVKATGNPVTFSNGTDASGRAERLEYDVADKTIKLFGNAFVTQGERQFSGEEIIYSLVSKRVQAIGGKGRRVRLVLPPSDTSKTGNDKSAVGKAEAGKSGGNK
jgi:lipopolysaccharide export system protein LptA